MENGLKVTKANPSLSSNIFSKLTFWWMIGLFKKGSLKITDIYKPLPEDESEKLADRLEEYWKEEILRGKRKPNLLRVLCRMFAARYMFLGFLTLILHVIIRAYTPIVLSELIAMFSAEENAPDFDIYFNGALLVGLSLVQVFLFHHISLAQNRVGMRVRIACSSLIYRKALKLNKKTSDQTTSGQVVNLLSNDVSRFDLLPMFLHWIWLTPIHVAVLTYLIWQQVGLASLAGTFTMFGMTIPLQGYLGKVTAVLRRKATTKTDSRIKKMLEIVTGIQIIKLYAWERPFQKIVEKLRASEIKVLRHLNLLKGVLLSFAVFMERTTLFITVVCFVLLGNEITASKAFSIAQFFNSMQMSVAIFFPLAINISAETAVTLKRLEEFLTLEERGNPAEATITLDGSVTLDKVNASWGSVTATIKDLTLHVPSGGLCAIVGAVGAGKTTLLQILLNELEVQTGKTRVGGSLSYAAQEPWLFFATVRQNILFGQQYDRNLYRKVVEACCLQRDFELFPDGDKTFVGERGVALSGGQRARINLARAVYRQADVYLFDDPFSAVDTRVGKQIFENCIVRHLRGKTRIVVTHQVHLLEAADLIVVLNEGSVVTQGKYNDVMQKQLHLMTEIAESEEHQEIAKPVRNRLNSSVSTTSNLSTLVETPDFEALNEETFEMERNNKIYWKYFKAGGNWCRLILLVVVMVASQISCNIGDLWLSFWTQQSEIRAKYPDCIVYENYFSSPNTNQTFYYNTKDCIIIIRASPNIYIYIYTAIIIASILLTTLRSMLFLSIVMNSAKNLHNAMFESLIRAPMRFFDSNPSGRILNRFSRDMGAVDDLLPRVMLEAVQVLLVMTGILVMVLVANYYMIAAVVLLTIALWRLKTVYVAVAKNIKHLEAIAKSPVFSHFNATLNGLTTIRAAKAEDKLRQEFDKHQDAHTSAWFLTLACISSFGLWLDFICVVFIAVITFGFIALDRTSTISGSLVGLALSQSLILTGMVQHGVRQFAEVVSQMTSVERIMEYIKIEKEAGFAITNNTLGTQWPHNGQITFSKLTLFYNPTDPPVLKNLTFNIEAKQKVGIVGRTGAGKSSLIAALFNLTPYDGTITIDNVDTKTVPLNELRKKISIIPQEPVLFAASMRFNLDPFNEFEDTAIWNALEQVELKDAVHSLEFYVQEGGKNLSTGQRQLVCLARAILRNNKVLVLDEATANIDQTTDALIQATIRREFSDCTVLTIAHRLNTIMDSDKVLVMDAGDVAEFDHPFELLQNTQGTFYKMVAQTGASVMAELIAVAAKSYEKIINHSQ